MTRDAAFVLVRRERMRQSAMWAEPHQWGQGDCSSSDVSDPVKAAVLAEECGEVAKAVLEEDQLGLRRELAQVAAVAVAWLEAL
jgi:NTP pyrophosphatase (non-canonical NTP hydrolase)